ncbi:FbpB family small basic protein [Halobacillus sp. A1]|uniref:FbpB family small basic protein n=1 Tax=Halobacillus campisalis TaxID=435909 RepID=A0ABW2K1H4_9BACI|nr:FbpB family small basic protein [Halobacillus campisalis]MCP3031297.1 FbpB family small basic protein [Halobacillus sp. A1]
MRQKQKISYQERIQQNIKSIMEDPKLLDQIEQRIDERHHRRLKKIPS